MSPPAGAAAGTEAAAAAAAAADALLRASTDSGMGGAAGTLGLGAGLGGFCCSCQGPPTHQNIALLSS